MIPPGMRDFQDCVRHCELTDMSYQGQRYAWCNKREDGVICKKLDRVLVNQQWLQQYGHSYSVFEPGGCSDHFRCRIHISEEAPRIQRPFKFVNAVVTHPDFHQALADKWRESPPLFHSTSTMHRFTKSLKGLKPLIRNLGKQVVGTITKRTKAAYARLCDLQQATMANPSSLAVREEAEAFAKWRSLSDIEERYLQQKAKLHWLKIGD
ncbi:PREDICTED: uncharacterized protein LOC104753759 [Camelina sativa]|uniref:Uncharacterized protein LOC104753759 n=1 Tax=Camelina sativa TaxID=90675 RepID=A0ABM0WPM4_CAMSA|nr:PREDICTED: uncharacterized protein LOC104753759 [Camelina sativa]